MSRVVREPGCSAIASMGGTCDTYIVVAVAQERSSPCAAPTITTGCGICDRTVFAARYGSRSISALRGRGPCQRVERAWQETRSWLVDSLLADQPLVAPLHPLVARGLF